MLFRGLAQRTKGRKTSYLDALPGPTTPGKPPLGLSPPSKFRGPKLSDRRYRAAGLKTVWGSDETILRSRRNRAETNQGYKGNQQTAPKDASEASMNHSIHSADRATHVKIVVMALVAGIAVAGVAISARTNADYSQSARVIKAGKPVVLTSSDTLVIR
jgi:hypothetical protein